MAYIGKDTSGILNHNKLFETFTGDGIITSKVLSRTPGSVNNVDVFYDGAFQTPGVDFTLSGNTITFTSAPPNGVVVSILAGEDSQVITPEENTVTSTKIANNTITNSLLPSTIPSTKLKPGGALPAIDGSNLQNVSTGLLSGSSDPTITQNPAGGVVGTVYTNTETGEVFVLTDATTDANIWVNVGGGSGNIQNFPMGTIAGFSSCSNPSTNTVEKFTFANPVVVTDHGDLATSSHYRVGSSSKTHGYTAGGSGPQNIIDRFAFANSSSAAGHGNLETAIHNTQGASSETDGYVHGGGTNSRATIQIYSFASNTTGTTHGNLRNGRVEAAGCSSQTDGYCIGGNSNTGNLNTIDKYSFASNTTAADHGTVNTTMAKQNVGLNSKTDGFSCGGVVSSGYSTNIQKFSFASNTSAATHGSLTYDTGYASGQSGKTEGYVSGGSSAGVNQIQKVVYASVIPVVDVGDLIENGHGAASHQY